MERRESVLIIEDDRDLADLLRIHLQDAGFSVEHAATGDQGLRKATEGEHALILLDLMLPGVDGLEICRRVRERDRSTPIVMLTARTEELDKVVGLELGADDYVTKPFSIRELVARVKAVRRRVEEIHRRAEESASGQPLRFGGLTLDPARHRVTVNGSPVELTAKEFDLLALLAGNPGQAFNRQQLLDRVWGYQFDGYSHTVNSHINRLRSKIEEDASSPRYIRTVWGYGYRFAEPEEL